MIISAVVGCILATMALLLIALVLIFAIKELWEIIFK